MTSWRNSSRHQECSVIAVSITCEEKSNYPLFSAFYMYDAESLENCATFDDQYMIMVYNFKTTSYKKHCNLDDNLLFNLIYVHRHVNTFNYSDEAWSLGND